MQIFEYCLAEAAGKFSIGLIAWCAMSNHYHSVIHDPLGNYPEFLERLHKLLAKALNVRWKRWENLWSTEETNVVYLPTFEALIDKVCYVLSNPTADGLVDRLVDWPGSSSLHRMGGRTRTVSRPTFFFRKDGEMPKTVTLDAIQPPMSVAAGESPSEWESRIKAVVEASEERARAARLREGSPVMGRKAVLRVSAFDSPTTSEPRRELRPAVACRDPQRRIAELRALVEFRRRHEAARLRFVAGELTVEFPAGTFRMRRLGAKCVPLSALAA